MVKNCKDCFFNNKIILKSKKKFKSDHHNIYTKQINKIALSSNDDKRLQTSDNISIRNKRIQNISSFEETVKYKLLILIIMQMKTNRTQFKVAIYSRSSIQNSNNRRFWICICIWIERIIKFYKQPVRY